MQCYQMSLSFAGVPSYMRSMIILLEAHAVLSNVLELCWCSSYMAEYDYTVGSTCSVIKCP